MTANYAEPEFTLGLTDDQEFLATEYIRYADHRDPERIQAGVEVERWNCGEVLLYIVDVEEDERLVEATFEPDQLRDFTREVGHYWNQRNRLGDPEMTALNYISLIALYADGEITKAEIEEDQQRFEDGLDADNGIGLRSGLESLRFRKHDEEAK